MISPLFFLATNLMPEWGNNRQVLLRQKMRRLIFVTVLIFGWIHCFGYDLAADLSKEATRYLKSTGLDISDTNGVITWKGKDQVFYVRLTNVADGKTMLNVVCATRIAIKGKMEAEELIKLSNKLNSSEDFPYIKFSFSSIVFYGDMAAFEENVDFFDIYCADLSQSVEQIITNTNNLIEALSDFIAELEDLGLVFKETIETNDTFNI